MRIVTRPDFDGIVCAVLLFEAEKITRETLWVEPNEIQKKLITIETGDILANLPYDKNCSMWFDHHYTNIVPEKIPGAFAIAPSAAGVVYDYYKDKIGGRYDELVSEADKIDSAALSQDEVLHPEDYPYVLLSMTISGRDSADEWYWNRLTDLLRSSDIESVMCDSEVYDRSQGVINRNKRFHDHLLKHTTIKQQVAVTDFREFDKAPNGNRFLSYSLFPESIVSVKIRYDIDNRDKIILSVGHSIFNKNCKVNAGLLLSKYGGGGHFGAAGCSFPKNKADEYIPEIIETLSNNKPLD